MKKKSTQGFSLVEIIISTIILTIGVFWVYKLLGNNMLLLGKNDTWLTMKTLEQNLTECITYFSKEWISLSGSGFSITLWNDLLWCEKWSFDENYHFTGVTLSGETYYLYWKQKASWEIRYNIFSPDIGKLFKDEDRLFQQP